MQLSKSKLNLSFPSPMKVFCPAFYVAADHDAKVIVVVVRGTFSVTVSYMCNQDKMNIIFRFIITFPYRMLSQISVLNQIC